MERLTSKRDWIEAGKDLSNEWGYSHIWRRLKQVEDILGDTYDLDRLRELVDAEKAGRCMVLPCHVGEQVYYVANVVSPGYPDPVTKPEIFLRPFKIEWIYGIGKFVFLTREAAEAALAKEADHE